MISLHEIIRQYPTELQKPEFYEMMLKEYFHHFMLSSLFSQKVGSKFAFLGGTALRYFYDLKRFSEDLDFDCFDLPQDEFNKVTDKICKDLRLNGVEVEIEESKSRNLKAFRRIYIFPELKFKTGISQQKQAKFFIKIEAESQNFEYQPEMKILNGFGLTVPVKIVPLEILFSTKIAAAVRRKKDRDFYDIAGLMGFAHPDFKYLSVKCNISNSIQLKEALLQAASDKKLESRKLYDCEHVLFDKKDISKIRKFSEYVSSFNINSYE